MDVTENRGAGLAPDDGGARLRLAFPAAAIGVSSTVYTFGDTNAPFRDLAKEHEEEVNQQTRTTPRRWRSRAKSSPECKRPKSPTPNRKRNRREPSPGMLEAAKFQRTRFKTIEIVRDGTVYFAFRIRPLTEKEYEKCREGATKYVRNKQLGFKMPESTDSVKYRSRLIYAATDAEDRKRTWDSKQLWNALEQVGVIVITDTDVIDALTAFGLTAAEAGHFADILAAASSNANTNVAMVGETFKYVAPIVGALYKDGERAAKGMEDAALAVGLMANAGIQSAQAGTSLRSILTCLSTLFQSQPGTQSLSRSAKVRHRQTSGFHWPENKDWQAGLRRHDAGYGSRNPLSRHHRHETQRH